MVHGSRRSPRRPPSIFVPAVHLKSGVSQLVALTFKGVGYPAENGTMILTGPSTTNTSFLCIFVKWSRDQRHPTCIQMQHASYLFGSLSTEIILVLILDADVHVDARHRTQSDPVFQCSPSTLSFRFEVILGVQAYCLDVIYTLYI